MTIFKQIIGRGTRIREKEGKTHFVVMDFRNVTRLFADPDWDGPIEMSEGFQHKKESAPEPVKYDYTDTLDPLIVAESSSFYGDDSEKPSMLFVDKNGCPVKSTNKTISVYDTNGKLLRQEDIIDYTRTNIQGEYASLSDFIRKWKSEDKKVVIKEALAGMGIDLSALKREQNMDDVDDFDFICYVAYGKKPLTRKERAEGVKKSDFFSKYSDNAKAVLEMLLDRYMNQGITEIENAKVLSLTEFEKFGKPSKIVKLFGGKADYEKAVKALEEQI